MFYLRQFRALRLTHTRLTWCWSSPTSNRAPASEIDITLGFSFGFGRPCARASRRCSACDNFVLVAFLRVDIPLPSSSPTSNRAPASEIDVTLGFSFGFTSGFDLPRVCASRRRSTCDAFVLFGITAIDLPRGSLLCSQTEIPPHDWCVCFGFLRPLPCSSDLPRVCASRRCSVCHGFVLFGLRALD